MELTDYVLLPREQRTAHIDLTTDCVLSHVKGVNGGKHARKALLDYLGVLNDGSGLKVQCCHLCNNSSGSDRVCVSPLHTYFGTPLENVLDKPLEVRSVAGRKSWDTLSEEQKEERIKLTAGNLTNRSPEDRTATLLQIMAQKTQEEKSLAAKKGWETRRRKQQGGFPPTD